MDRWTNEGEEAITQKHQKFLSRCAINILRKLSRLLELPINNNVHKHGNLFATYIYSNK